MFILGLGHRARHGKDYAAKYIIRHAVAKGLDARKFGFADALKAHCRVAYGMREKDGRLLQLVGTDLYRRQDPNIWVRVLLDHLMEEKPDVAIITDMRFPNEADAIKGLGGFTAKIERVNADGTLFVTKDRDPNHESEIALTGYDFDWSIRVPDRQLDQLQKSAVEMFEWLHGQHLMHEELIQKGKA